MINEYSKKMCLLLTKEEEEICLNSLNEMEKEFTKILSHFPDINNIEPMTHTIDIENVILREDIPIESPEIEDLLRNTTNVYGREIEVPKVVGE